MHNAMLCVIPIIGSSRTNTIESFHYYSDYKFARDSPKYDNENKISKQQNYSLKSKHMITENTKKVNSKM